MEEEAVNLANILVNKYGEYGIYHGFRIFNNVENIRENTNKYIPYYEVRKHDKYLFVRVIPGFESHFRSLLEETEARIILEINDSIIESNLKSQDLEMLRQMLEVEKKKQKERVALVAPMIVKILNLEKSNKFIDGSYILERVKQEIILQTHWEPSWGKISETNSETIIELMRVKDDGNQWEIINSSLSKNNCENITVLLEKIEKSPPKMT